MGPLERRVSGRGKNNTKLSVAVMTCENKAVGRSGKPLVGAASTNFIHKCQRETCAAKAVGGNGKKLYGVAKSSFIKKMCGGRANDGHRRISSNKAAKVRGFYLGKVGQISTVLAALLSGA